VTTLLVDTSEGVTLRFEIAGAGSRLAAGLFDALILGAAYAFAGIGLFVVASFDPSGIARFAAGILLGGALLVAILYHVLFHALRAGQTPGKMLVGIRVMSVDGYPPGIIALVVRALVWLVDVLFWVPAPLGILTILATEKHQRLGDLAAGTLVVRAQQVRPAVEPWANERWSALAVRELALSPGLAARIGPSDVEFLRTLIARSMRGEIEPRIGAALVAEAAQFYAQKLDLAQLDSPFATLREIYLFARENVRDKAS
jgi:uncharacterized RDD family membrane protein YckC